MGKLIDGKWQQGDIITSTKKGAYDRKPRSFRDEISDQHPVFKPESDRYHLYVSYACPWAHRALILRKLKNLESHISVSVVHPHMLENGWSFAQDFPETTGDPLYHSDFLYQIYQKADPNITTSVTVPLLWDKKTEQVVNNESAEIIRIFNTGFNDLTGNTDDYYPYDQQAEIDDINDRVYHNVNNGVYKAGFAKTQGAYDQAVDNLFDTLDDLDQRLENNTHLIGNTLTEADIRLITTLLRFDVVYYVHFKANIQKISEYKNLHRYMRDLYDLPAIRETTNFEHIKQHYYYSHKMLNPYQIIPKGPRNPV
jgi:putative glutathione S-transferase